MDLIKVLGPYGKRFVTTPIRTPNSARPAAVVNPNNSRIASVRRAVRLSAGNREKFHKKTNLAFLRDGEGRVVERLIDIEKRQKDRRAQVVMENRMPNPQYPNVSDSRMTRAMASKVSSVTLSAPASKDKQGSNARAEQLAKWKREKEELNKQKLAIRKPPFKVMASTVSNTNYPNVSETRMATRAMTSKASTTVSSKTSTAVISKASSTVTSKATTTVTSTTKDSQRYTSVERLEQIAKLRREKEEQKQSKTKLSAKRPPSKTSQHEHSESAKVLVTPAKVEQVVAVQAETPTTPVILEEPPKVPVTQTKVEQAQVQVTPPVTENVTQAKVPPKKKKGMQFDANYMEYNNVFIQTCACLMQYSQQWTKILAETSDIPEEVIEDIQSTLGQSQLLMESKLPQFGELLYFYLSRHQDPGPVLPCDLQGWWAVASISIEKVKQRFEKLITMSNNNWELPKPIPIKRSRPALLPQKQKQNDTVAEPDKEKAPKASAGLRAFLAGKRKNKVDPEVEVQPPMEPVIEQTKVQPAVSKIETAVEFEEGFRSIQTPVRTPSNASSASLFRVTGSHALHSDPRINRRQSSSNTSLRMLAVRSSMGSICKIGLEAGSYSPKISPVALKFIDSDSDP